MIYRRASPAGVFRKYRRAVDVPGSREICAVSLSMHKSCVSRSRRVCPALWLLIFKALHRVDERWIARHRRCLEGLRRSEIVGIGSVIRLIVFVAIAAIFVARVAGAAAAEMWTATNPAPDVFRTPYKLGRLVLEKSTRRGGFDSRGVDSAFVFSVNGVFYMTYVGFDGIGYQTGLAQSDDLIHWRKLGIILARNPRSKYTRYNAALTSILRDDELAGLGPAIKVDGQYVASWNAYPKPGYEGGAAVIGLARSPDLRHWKLGEPILHPEDGQSWERGGLYKSHLLMDAGTYYIFYNAKNQTAGLWFEQTGFATSFDLVHWTRYPGNPVIQNGPADSVDERFASDPVVLRYHGLWGVYYFGLSADNHARELLTLGADPEHLSKVPDPVIDVGPPGSIDDRYAHKPAVISWRGDLYHFYTGASGRGFGEGDDVRGITVARSRPW
jgi:Glycosyl hydrolases family 32 N-terminal domain